MGFAVGETVGPYKITHYIGQGGMATIYRAHQATLTRDVALKVIHPALREDQSFVARLRREAQVVANLHHPHIVDVYDYAEHEGTPYVVMRFIDGKTLKEIAQERTFTPQEIFDLIRPVAEALAYAHVHGVLHRDVKLSNIMCDNEGGVFLADFGLARLTYKGESTLSRDMLIGSPQYISPEMAKGDPIDARADIYSLGIVLFELFAGRLPFIADTPYATVVAHINTPVPDAGQFNKAVSPAIDAVLKKALAKDPAERYASVEELMIELERAVYGSQASARSASEGTPRFTPPPVPRQMNVVTPRPAALGQSQASKGKPWAIILAALIGLGLAIVCLVGISVVALQPLLFGASPTPRALAPTVVTATSVPSTATGVILTPATPTPTQLVVRSPTPTIPPGVYVTALRVEPPEPKYSQAIKFHATFLNTTGVDQGITWFVYIYRGDRRVGQTTKNCGLKLAQGSVEVPTCGTWSWGPGEPFVDFVAKVHTIAADNNEPVLNNTNGKEFTLPFRMLP